MIKTSFIMGITFFFLCIGISIPSYSTPLSATPQESSVLTLSLNEEELPGAKIIITSTYDATGGMIIRGIVIDEWGFALPGVLVEVKDMRIGTITAIDGYFELRITKIQKITVTFSYVGLKAVVMQFTSTTTVTIIMKEDTGYSRSLLKPIERE